VNRRSAPWARAIAWTALARSKIQASACRRLPSPTSNFKKHARSQGAFRGGAPPIFYAQKNLF